MKRIKWILASMGIGHHTERHETELMYDEAVFLNLAISIDNHLKIKQLMSQIDELILAEQAEKETISELANAVVSLAEAFQGLEKKYNDLVFQGTSVTAITAEQFQELSGDIATGKQLASDALAKAQAALTPATAPTLVTEPVADPVVTDPINPAPSPVVDGADSTGTPQ